MKSKDLNRHLQFISRDFSLDVMASVEQAQKNHADREIKLVFESLVVEILEWTFIRNLAHQMTFQRLLQIKGEMPHKSLTCGMCLLPLELAPLITWIMESWKQLEEKTYSLEFGLS